MSGFQKIIVTGNLGQTPECRTTQNGDAVVNLSVAVNRVWYKKDDDEKQEEVTWYRVPLWREQAEDAQQYLVKGQEVTVCGRLVTDGNGNPPTWVDDAGLVHASFEVFPTERIVYGPKPGGNGNDGQEETGAPARSTSRHGASSKGDSRSPARSNNAPGGNGSTRRLSAQRPRQPAASSVAAKDNGEADAWNFE